MDVKFISEQLGLKVLCGESFLDRKVEGGFVGDLLSVVMGKAEENNVWVTIQGHINIVAVATLINVACIIVSEGYDANEDTLLKATEEEIPILSTTKSSFEIVRELVQLGI